MVLKQPEDKTSQPPEILKSLLNQEGFRLTSQRQKILSLFEEEFTDHHLSAEEIHQKLVEKGEKISFSTIYRALHIMVDLSLLRELELAEGRKFYELCTPLAHQHHHLVCIQCGGVNEFTDDQITQVSSRETVRFGFSFVNSQFTVYGVCSHCQAALQPKA